MFDSPPRHHLFGSCTRLFDSPPVRACTSLFGSCTRLFDSCTSLFGPVRFSPHDPHVTATLSSPCSDLAQACSGLFDSCTRLFGPVRFLHKTVRFSPHDPHVTVTLSSPVRILRKPVHTCSSLFGSCTSLFEPARACCARYLVFFIFCLGEIGQIFGIFRSVFFQIHGRQIGGGVDLRKLYAAPDYY